MSEMMHTSNANIEAKLEALMQQLQSNTLQGGTAPTDAFEAEEEVISIDRSFALQPEAFRVAVVAAAATAAVTHRTRRTLPPKMLLPKPRLWR